MAALLTLKDGYQVTDTTMIRVLMELNVLTVEHPMALSDLVKKCQQPTYAFTADSSGDSRKILKQYSLLNEHDEIFNEDVRRIVVNSFQGSGLSQKFVSPLEKDRVTG